MLSVNIGDIAVITVKNADYRYIIHNIGKSEAINLLESFVLKDRGYTYKKYCLNFQSTQGSFFLLFRFSIYKMGDSEYGMDVHKSVKISIGTVMRNPEMLKSVPDHLKAKKCVGMQIKSSLICSICC